MSLLKWITIVALATRCSAYVMLTANIEDIKNIAKGLSNMNMPDPLRQFWSRATNTFNDALRRSFGGSKPNDDDNNTFMLSDKMSSSKDFTGILQRKPNGHKQGHDSQKSDVKVRHKSKRKEKKQQHRRKFSERRSKSSRTEIKNAAHKDEIKVPNDGVTKKQNKNNKEDHSKGKQSKKRESQKSKEYDSKLAHSGHSTVQYRIKNDKDDFLALGQKAEDDLKFIIQMLSKIV